MWRQAMGIVKKDVRYLFRERQQIIVYLLLPILIFFLFVAVFGGVGGDGGFSAEVAVVDLDGGNYSARIMENMTSAPGLKLEHFNETVGNLTAAEDLLSSGDVDVLVVFPAGFSDDLEHGRRATVNLTVDATEPTVGMTANQTLMAFFANETVYLQQEAAAAMQRQASGQLPATGFMAQPVGLETTGVTHEVYDQRAALLAQAASFAIIWVGVMTGAGGLAFERVRKTLGRIVTSPAPAVSVFVGKLVAYTIELLICVAVMVLIAVFGLGVRISVDPLTLVVVLVLAVMPAIALGMVFSSLVRNPQNGANLAWVFAMPAGFIGGAFVPPEILPASTAPIQAAFPFATAYRMLEDTFVRGYGITQMLDSAGYLLLLAAIYVTLGFLVYVTMQRRGRLA